MTKQELEAMSDLLFAAGILQEKVDQMYNPYTPLAKKLRGAIGTLKAYDEREKNPLRNHWSLTITNEAGERIDALGLPAGEVSRICSMIGAGFNEGEVAAEPADGGGAHDHLQVEG